MDIRYMLTYRPFLILLFIINLFGTIYGYMWYESQLAITPAYFIPFVPDSPTATLFFTIFLLFFIFNKNVPYIEALAITSLIKYGVWAVVMNIFTLIVTGDLRWEGYMLMVSHGLMAVQGILYAPHYKIKLRHLTLAGIVLLHNEIIDYVYGMMPIYSSLNEYMKEIGYFTFWLSVFTIILTYHLTIKKQNKLD
ncbi:MAG TPA: DUF1405 domain-containing protein [Pseudogracilibacillus sp.]|nr:DUF1405 domain-containing protein [Pseudogracilibacillus sp.]